MRQRLPSANANVQRICRILDCHFKLSCVTGVIITMGVEQVEMSEMLGNVSNNGMRRGGGIKSKRDRDRE